MPGTEQRYETLKQDLDEAIRKGRIDEAKEKLRALNLARLPREHAADFAVLARRVRLTKVALQILRPIVRADRPLQLQPSPEELAAYAAALSRVGAIDEALEILSTIRESSLADVPLYTAFAHIFRWDYAAAIPWLKKYLRFGTLTPYERLVGKINLASCYVFEGMHADCEELILEIISVATANDWRLLAMNAYEIRAQLAISQGQLEAAKDRLKQASLVARTESMDERFIHKWLRIIQLKESGPTPETLHAMAEFRSEALGREDWETVRLCDYYMAVVEKDSDLFTQVFAGTPHVSFRRKMEQDVNGWFALPSRYRWHIGGPYPSTSCLDVRTGQTLDSHVSLKAGQGPHRLLQALTQDFYRPTLTGTLFASVFPGEHFDPKSSPKRIEQHAARLRRWFSEHQIPLSIDVREGAYRLRATAPIDLIVSVTAAEVATRDPFERDLAALKRAWPYKAFSSRQAAEHLERDLEDTRRFLNEAVERKSLLRLGRGRGTLFRFPASQKEKS